MYDMSENELKARTQRVEVSFLVRVHLSEVCIGPLGMFLLEISVQGVFMPEDEVQFVVFSTLIWPEHDGVGCAVMKLLLQLEVKEQLSDKCLEKTRRGMTSLKSNMLTNSRLGVSDSNLM